MLISAVVAVALGVASIGEDGYVQPIGDYPVGRFTQITDGHGTTHVRGRDSHGVPYEIVLDRNGYVEAEIGDRVVSFRVQDAG